MDIIFTVSARLSPFWVDEEEISEIPKELPPIDAMADSKLRRVLVLGS